MSVKAFQIKCNNSKTIALELKKSMNGFSPNAILYFAASEIEPNSLSTNIKEQFLDCKVFGCTSHSEYCGDNFISGSFVAMAFDKESISDVHIQVIQNIKQNPDIQQVVENYQKYFDDENIEQSIDKYFGIIMFDGSSKAEEKFMDKIGNITNLQFIGGSSANSEEGITGVFAEDKFYTDAAVLAVFKVNKGYNVFKTQSISVCCDKPYIVTKSDIDNRIIYEFSGRPVAEVYAEALDIDKNKIADYFVSNPLGIVAGDEIFVRTFNEILGEGISAHCCIEEGTEIYILKLGNIVEDTKKALTKALNNEDYKGLVNFNCLYRTLEIQNTNSVEDYCELFSHMESIGLSTFGEILLAHMNQTSTILLIK